MSTAHTHEQAPDSLTPGINRLLIIAAFAALAALVWYVGGYPMHSKKHALWGDGYTFNHNNQVSTENTVAI